MAILFCTALTGCSSAPVKYWPSKTAQVLDKDNNEPIADVYVVAKWKGRGMVQSFCYHVETAKTDKDGYFTIPGTLDGPGKSFWSQRHVLVYFYKPGYTDATKDGKSYYSMNKVVIEKSKGTRKERFVFLSKHGARFSCRDAGSSKRNLYAAKKAIYREAKSLNPTSKEEMKSIYFMRLNLASLIDTSHQKYTGIQKEKKIEEIIRIYEQELLESSE